MITTEVNTPTPIAPTLRFPLLARSIQNGQVVLFTDPEKGVVVHNSPIHRLGEYLATWTPVTYGSTWEILPVGSNITITQK